MYHYTNSLEALDSILKSGIRTDAARGGEYGEPNAVWGSAQQPDDNLHAYVEAHIPYKDYEPGSMGLPSTWHASDDELAKYNEGNANFALAKDVPPERIVAHSTPAIHTLRYIEGERESLGGQSAAEHFGDVFSDDEPEGWAVKEYDRRHPRPQRTLMTRPDQR
jgi:hypothetical protein